MSLSKCQSIFQINMQCGPSNNSHHRNLALRQRLLQELFNDSFSVFRCDSDLKQFCVTRCGGLIHAVKKDLKATKFDLRSVDILINKVDIWDIRNTLIMKYFYTFLFTLFTYLRILHLVKWTLYVVTLRPSIWEEHSVSRRLQLLFDY